MHKILCSTGALIGRPHNGDFRFIEKCLPELKCDGLEFMLYGMWYDKIAEVTDFLKSLGVAIPVFHAEKRLGDIFSRNSEGDVESAVEKFKINARIASEIGADKVVLHLWGGIDSDRDIAHNIRLYKSLRAVCEKYCVELCVENIVCNVKDPLTHLNELAAEYPDISFTYDTKMAQFHNQLMTIFEPENISLFSHVKHMHVNDYAGGYMDWSNLRTLNLGCGNVDFDSFIPRAIKSGYAGDFTVEATSYNAEGVVDFNALNNSFAKIREYLK